MRPLNGSDSLSEMAGKAMIEAAKHSFMAG
jgi:hypothetical protein